MPRRIVKVLDTKDFDALFDEYKNEHDVRFEFSVVSPVTDNVSTLCKSLIKENSINSLCLDFTNHLLSERDVSELAAFLQSDNCPSSINLILTKTSLSEKSLNILANALSSGCRASEVNLGLCNNRLGNDGAVLFATALQSEHCPSKVSLNLASNDISDKGFVALADVLKSPLSVKKLSLNLLFNPTSKVGSLALIEGIQCGVNKEGVDIKYEFSKHGTGVILSLANVLKSNECPNELALHFGVKHLTTAEIGILFSALKEMKGANQLDLDLSEQGVKDVGFVAILDALPNLNEDLRLKLHLVYNSITLDGAKKLSELIRADKIQSEVYMDLSQNTFGGKEGRRLIYNAIVKNPQILSRLTIQGPTKEIDELCSRIRENDPVVSNKSSLPGGCSVM